MKAMLSLEFIGASTWDRVRALGRYADAVAPALSRSLVGDVTAGPSVHEIRREGAKEVFGDRDYSKANSKGSRGVRIRYILESDKLYFVRAPYSWRGVDEYFCAVDEVGNIYRLSATEVDEWRSAL